MTYPQQVEALILDRGGLYLSPAEFQLVEDWEALDIPLSIIVRGVDEKLGRMRKQQSRARLRLCWCHDDIQRVYQDWRRALGPRA